MSVHVRPCASVSVPGGASGDQPSGLLQDLGLLRSQIHRLLEEPAGGEEPGAADMREYRELIELGVDHKLLAPHFRRWLRWRTAPEALRRYLAAQGHGPAARMSGRSLREWLLWCWVEQFPVASCELRHDQAGSWRLEGTDSDHHGRARTNTDTDAVTDTGTIHAPCFTALIGPTGGGKTTTLAKLASIYRQKKRQNVVILTLDTRRFGATEQWRKLGKLLDVEIHEIVTQEDLVLSMESWDRFGWVGIDTPGGMTPDSPAGRLYGSILAHCPKTETAIVLPATHQETASRRQMDRGRALGADRLLFSKLDETESPGSIINLTMNTQWKIDGFTAGTRVPEDWEPAAAETLWRRVLKGETAAAADFAMGAGS